jgi:hypothetical protein
VLASTSRKPEGEQAVPDKTTPVKPGSGKQVSTVKYVAKDRRPVPQQRPNFIPAQSWLAYSFIDKDPELDHVIWAIGESGWSAEKIEQETEKLGRRVSRYTVLNWCYGDVKRPQNISMNNVMAVLGYSRMWKRSVE